MISKTSQVRDFFGNAESYLSGDFVIRLRSLIVADLLKNLPKGEMIDLGCGDGRISLQFLPAVERVVLVDFSEDMLRRAALNVSPLNSDYVKYFQGDLNDYLEREAFDTALCVGVLAHVESLERTIALIQAMLKPGGHCVLQITDYESILGKLIYHSANRRRRRNHGQGWEFNKTGFSQIVSMAERNNLNHVAHQRYSLLLPGMGILPDIYLYRFSLFSLRNQLLSRFGSEVILIFQRC